MPNMNSDRDTIKARIEERFTKNVKGKKPDLSQFNSTHDGREGDWLTKAMGLNVNGINEPDFEGFEMKKYSVGKTSFGDWSPDESLYSGALKKMSRDEFLQMFGVPNPKKGGRFSWSGKVFPKYGEFNDAGQRLAIDDFGNIVAIYRFGKDSRKISVAPEFHHGEIVLARWREETLKLKLERKFNQLGWFRCLKNNKGEYERIIFGNAINYESFLSLVITGDIFLDCGMHQGNARPYMIWRASNRVWDKLAET